MIKSIGKTLVALVLAVMSIIGLSACAGEQSAPQQSSEAAVSSADVEQEMQEDNEEPELPPIKESVEDYTWDELSALSAALEEESSDKKAIDLAIEYHLATAEGKLDGTQVKLLQLSDGTTASVFIAGFRHDVKSSGKKAGITFMFSTFIGDHDMNPRKTTGKLAATNSGGWEDSGMRSWLNSDAVKLLPSDLSNCIVEVSKSTNNTGATESVSSVTKTSDRLWLFSYVEVLGKTNKFHSAKDKSGSLDDVLNAEGSQYKVFQDLGIGSSDTKNPILTKSSSWFERSPYPEGSTSFYAINIDGVEDHIAAFEQRGVVPGFCI